MAQDVLSPLHGMSSDHKVESMIACATTLATILLNPWLAPGTSASVAMVTVHAAEPELELKLDQMAPNLRKPYCRNAFA